MRLKKTGIVMLALTLGAAGVDGQSRADERLARVAEVQAQLAQMQLEVVAQRSASARQLAGAQAAELARVDRVARQAALLQAERFAPALGAMAAGQSHQMELAQLQAELAQVRAVSGTRALRAGRAFEPLNIPESWNAQDPADSLYRAARRALNARSYRDAIRMYAQIRSSHPNSTYVADSYYWQAQALYRQGGGNDLNQAVELLSAQMDRFPDAATAEDARSLLVRVQSQQAQRGNANAARAVAQQASNSCDEEEDSMRSAALSALIQMDSDRAAPILREVLRDQDECSQELREQAIFLLAQNPDPETVQLLLDLAHRNPDPSQEVREAAVFWLSQVDSEEALDALLSILESGTANTAIQERAIFAISQHDSERVAPVLREYASRNDVPLELRRNAIHWIGQRDGGAEYLRTLYSGSNDPEIREQILFAVSQSRTAESRSWLMARAMDTSEDTEVRKKALFWAGQSGVAIEDVLRVYRTADDRELREQAIFVVSQTRSTEAVDALMSIARDEEDRELKEKAVFWLGQSRDPRVAEFLLELIRGG